MAPVLSMLNGTCRNKELGESSETLATGAREENASSDTATKRTAETLNRGLYSSANAMSGLEFGYAYLHGTGLRFIGPVTERRCQERQRRHSYCYRLGSNSQPNAV